MWWHERGAAMRGGMRAAAAVLLAALTAACFQPLYGERSFNGGPGLREALAGVEIAEIEAPAGEPASRLAVEIRNELNSALAGGRQPGPPTHRLTVSISQSTSSMIVDPTTARAEFEIVTVNANYRLVDIASKKQVMDGAAIARTSYDVPGQQQRYTMLRGRRDSQSNAAKVVAEQIRNRLASYFAAGS